MPNSTSRIVYENVVFNESIPEDTFGLNFIGFDNNAAVDRYDIGGGEELYFYVQEFKGLLPMGTGFGARAAIDNFDILETKPIEIEDVGASAVSEPAIPESSSVGVLAKTSPEKGWQSLLIPIVVAAIALCVIWIIFYHYSKGSN